MAPPLARNPLAALQSARQTIASMVDSVSLRSAAFAFHGLLSARGRKVMSFDRIAFATLLVAQAALLLVALLQCENPLDFVAAGAGAVSSGAMSALLLHPANH